jgi:hypothetical protein
MALPILAYRALLADRLKHLKPVQPMIDAENVTQESDPRTAPVRLAGRAGELQ